jgi:hypothetical protein
MRVPQLTLIKLLVASVCLSYYDGLAVAFETSPAERLTNDACSYSALLCVTVFRTRRRSGAPATTRCSAVPVAANNCVALRSIDAITQTAGAGRGIGTG